MATKEKPTAVRRTWSVISYCDIPESITEKDNQLKEASCDSFIETRITPKDEQAQYDGDFDLDNWAIKTFPELEGRTILIHIDY